MTCWGGHSGANVQPGQPASCAGRVVGGLTGEGGVSLLPADGDGHHADDSCDDAGGEQADCRERDQSRHDGPPDLDGCQHHCPAGLTGQTSCQRDEHRVEIRSPGHVLLIRVLRPQIYGRGGIARGHQQTARNDDHAPSPAPSAGASPSRPARTPSAR